MSEQTPDTDNGIADGQDPSMEDILASIRKIIAEDDNQDEAEQSSVDNMLELTEDETAEGDVAELAIDTNLEAPQSELLQPEAKGEVLDLDILAEEENLDQPDIDALIGDMDDAVLDTPPVADFTAKAEATEETDLDNILSLDIPTDEGEAITLTETAENVATAGDDVSLALDEGLDLTADAEPLALENELAEMLAEVEADETNLVLPIEDAPKKRGLMGGAMAALGLGGAAAAAAKSSADETVKDVISEPEDDLSLMLDNMLEDSAAYQDEPDAPLQDEVEAAPLDIDDVDTAESDPDMDLVKSLMADLTEEPLHEDEAQEEVTAEAEREEDTSDDVIDDILSMTLDDETKLSEELAIPELDVPQNAPESAMSLKDIAAAAEAEAKSANNNLGKGLAAAAGLGAVGAAAAISQNDDEAQDEIEAPEADIKNNQIDTPPAPQIEETPDMARAKKSDAIIDEVTETATTGAFASLTSVVEEKAVKAERGDRIGDLVMEALQPMLKEWLDANLKGIVERAVTKEVKRISSGK